MHEPRRRKTFRRAQPRTDAVRGGRGATTDTERSEQALELIVFRDRLCEGVRRMRGAGLVDVFHEHSAE
jgi:hypothetical protein